MVDALWQDLRYAARMLRLHPGFAIVAIVSLALGAGANTAIFELLDAIRLRTLPVKAPRELVELRIDDMTAARGNWVRAAALTTPLWEEIRDHQQSFSGTFAWADVPLKFGASGEAREVSGLWVSGDFFPVLDIHPLLGRLFTPDDDRRGCGVIGAVISYGFWQREFGGDRSIIGKKIAFEGQRVKVIGVTPPEFSGLEVGRTFDISMPICVAKLTTGTDWWLTVMGRMKPGMRMEQASAALQSMSPGIFEATLPAGYPAISVKPYLAMKLFAIPAGTGISRLRDRYAEPLGLLLAIAGFVLLIACANLANLMLARASARHREIAVRLAVGATRARLVQQLMIEGMLLAIAGTALGLILARVLSRFLVSFIATGNNSMFVDLHQDWRVFIFTAGLAAIACLLFALTPALSAARIDPADALRSQGRSATSGRERLGMRRVLVVSQIALSLALLVGALLFARTLGNLRAIDPGFDPRGVIFVEANFFQVRLPPERVVSFRREMLERLRAIPGAEVAETTIVPATGANRENRMWLDGAAPESARVCRRTMIGTEYFPTLKTPLLAGRDFDEHDLAPSSDVAVVNEAFARQLAGSWNAIGKRFWIEATPTAPQSSYVIVGVVKNAKFQDLREDFQPVVFLPLSKSWQGRPYSRFMIRSHENPQALAQSVKATLGGISPDVRYSLKMLDSWIQESLLRERLMATISALFGVLALLLTSAGLYGVISYIVVLRTNEIGIRIALGASRRGVIALILRETATVLAIGLAAGTILAIAASRTAASLLFGLKSYDPLTFAAAAIALIIVVAAASIVPAWRASSVNPLIALRHE